MFVCMHSMLGIYCQSGQGNHHLLHDIISCCLLFDKRDRGVTLASVALSAVTGPLKIKSHKLFDFLRVKTKV